MKTQGAWSYMVATAAGNIVVFVAEGLCACDQLGFADLGLLVSLIHDLGIEPDQNPMRS